MKVRSKKFLRIASVSALMFSMLLGGMVASSSKQVVSEEVTAQAMPANYYSSVTDSMSGQTLLNQLNKIIGSGVSVSKDWSRFEQADQDPNNSSNILTIYARTSLKKSAHVNGQNVGWNREHTYPDSKISGNAESDNHILYASDAKVNGARGNYKIGDLTGYTPNVNDSYGNSTTCMKYTKSGTVYFDPGNRARGIVARSTFYAAAMYGLDVTGNFESLELALKWNLQYAPDNFDSNRNDVVYGNQHNRNPFVDHPEYACRIWGNTNDRTKAVCGGQDLPKSLQTLSLDSEPTKKVYYVGEIFDPSGTKVTAYYSDGSSADVTSSVVWPTTPLVKNQLYVHGTYTEGGIQKTVAVTNLTVQEKGADYVDVTGVTLNKNSITLKVGDTASLTATVAPSNATNKTVTWSSSNNEVATVDSNGKVTAKAVGKTEITANASGKTVKCIIEVKAGKSNGGDSNEDKPNKSTTKVILGIGKYEISMSGTEAVLISIAIVAVIGGAVFAAIFIPLKVLKKRKNK